MVVSCCCSWFPTLFLPPAPSFLPFSYSSLGPSWAAVPSGVSLLQSSSPISTISPNYPPGQHAYISELFPSLSTATSPFTCILLYLLLCPLLCLIVCLLTPSPFFPISLVTFPYMSPLDPPAPVVPASSLPAGTIGLRLPDWPWNWGAVDHCWLL